MLRLALPWLSFAAVTFFAPAWAAAPREPVPGEIVVLTREGAPARANPPARVLARAGDLGLTHERRVAPASARRPYAVHVFRTGGAGVSPEGAAAALRAEPDVLAAIPNHRLRLFPTLPNDPMRPLQWHVDSGDSADIELPAAWDVARGDSAVVIGVMDTGVDLGHPDLAGKIWTNGTEAAGTPGVDDDGNGWTDDVHGWDFGDDDADPSPAPFFDEIGLDAGFHGTFVAGLAAAATDNAIGIAGAGWNCRVLPLKVSDANNAIESAALAGAFAYATDLGVAVLNMSLGGPGAPGVPEFFQTLVDAADAAGVVSVAAAGNDGTADLTYPAACDRVLAVAATDESRQRASFSNFGPWVDLAAPGAYLWSSICRNYVVDDLSQIFYFYFFEWDFEQPYMRGDGTSFAAPLVAGVAGLVRARHPWLTPGQTAAHLIATGDVIAFDQPIGPKVNAWRAVNAPVAAVASSPAAGLALNGVFPNPARARSVIRFTVARPEHARLEVFDVTGRRVRTLENGVLAPGPHERVWDGRDGAGAALPDGIYVVRLAAGGASRTVRAVRLGAAR